MPEIINKLIKDPKKIKLIVDPNNLEIIEFSEAASKLFILSDKKVKTFNKSQNFRGINY